MNLITLVEPTVEPVALADVYLHLRLTPDLDGAHPDDALLNGQIAASRIWAEQYTRRAFVTQQLRLTTERFPFFSVAFGGFGYWPNDPDDCMERNGYIELRRPPLIGLTAVSYFDENNALQTVDPDSYYLTSDLVPRVQFVDEYSAPSLYMRDDAVRIDYVAGYPPSTALTPDLAANVPAGIKQAILLGVQLLYDQLATDQRTALEAARESLLSSYRVHSL